MLAAHLNPEIDAASRRTDTINQTVNWLIKTLALEAGASVLDLGCGPGLYTSRLAKSGMKVTGVDYSHRSIEFASNYAAQNGLVSRIDFKIISTWILINSLMPFY